MPKLRSQRASFKEMNTASITSCRGFLLKKQAGPMAIARARTPRSVGLLSGVGEKVARKLWRETPTGKLDRPTERPDLGFFFIGKGDIECPPILFQVLDLLRPWDGEDVATLLEKPCEGELGYSTAFLVSQGLEPVDDVDIVVAVGFLEARQCKRANVFVVAHRLAVTEGSCEYATPQRRGYHKRNSKFAASGQEIRASGAFDIMREH